MGNWFIICNMDYSLRSWDWEETERGENFTFTFQTNYSFLVLKQFEDI